MPLKQIFNYDDYATSKPKNLFNFMPLPNTGEVFKIIKKYTGGLLEIILY